MAPRQDGPVVKAAQQALETGDVNLVLLWVRPEDKPEIGTVFAETLLVRKQSGEARELADRFFQRAGDGQWTSCRQAAPTFPAPGGAGLVQPPAAGTVIPGPAPAGAPRP